MSGLAGVECGALRSREKCGWCRGCDCLTEGEEREVSQI